MRPLDPLRQPAPDAGLPQASDVARLLLDAPPKEVRTELARLDALALAGAPAAARIHARGALALREGRLDDACEAFEAAAAAFEQAGEAEAAALAAAESWLARIRRGPRSVYAEAIDALAALGAAHPESRLVQVVATHYRATALRYSGRAEATLEVLLEAFAASDGLLPERAQVLNSLGTLYVVLGAYGAARSVLEHAAELNHQIGDRVSEAISYGQLGSAALAQGQLDEARRYLQKQEWFASRVGDPFGQARALVLLADLAIDLGRPDDAIELAEQARRVAAAVTPPLGMWIAYATRSIARAKVEIEDDSAARDLADARERFGKMGNQLGEAMVTWDAARMGAQRDSAPGRGWRDSAWAFATLGLSARVAQLLSDLRAQHPTTTPAGLDTTVAAVGQTFPHLGHAQEVELVLSRPDAVAAIATRRIAGQRNLGRLAAQTLAEPGLYAAAIAAGAIGNGARPVPPPRSAATLLGQLPGLAVWIWSGDTTASELARDLSALRAALGEDTRATLGWFPEARVGSVPFAGELGADLLGAELSPVLARALSDPPATLRLLAGVGWNGEAEALARMSGYESVR